MFGFGRSCNLVVCKFMRAITLGFGELAYGINAVGAGFFS
jgi:hypothetical protein